MHVDRLVARLRDHHGEIEARLREGQALLGLGDACRLKALGLARWQLMRALRSHQLFKHVEVFDPLIAAGRQPRAREAERLKGRCLAMGAAYQAHVARWSLCGPAHCWADYLRESDTIVRRIRAHLAEEAEAIDRLTASLRRIRQEDP